MLLYRIENLVNFDLIIQSNYMSNNFMIRFVILLNEKNTFTSPLDHAFTSCNIKKCVLGHLK
jgi:hypothetical protein